MNTYSDLNVFSLMDMFRTSCVMIMYTYHLIISRNKVTDSILNVETDQDKIFCKFNYLDCHNTMFSHVIENKKKKILNENLVESFNEHILFLIDRNFALALIFPGQQCIFFS